MAKKKNFWKIVKRPLTDTQHVLSNNGLIKILHCVTIHYFRKAYKLTSSQAKCPILVYSNLPLGRFHCDWNATYQTVWFTVLYRPNTNHIWSKCGNFTEKKFCPSRGLNWRPSDYQINCLIDCATATLYIDGGYRTKNI
jgi:hypothetical protein